MSSSNPVRCDPLLDWLQPFEDIWLMRKNREVIEWKYTRIDRSPDGDSQPNGRVENAIKKVRNMVETILSSLESRWSVRVARDHPVYPWVFEWAADVMTRNEHVGDLGRTAVQLIRGFTVKQKHCTIR